MAFLGSNIEKDEEDIPVVTATPESFKGTVVDSQYQPVSTLQAYMEGTPWPVDYYRQLLGENEVPKQTQQGLDAPYQQFELIHGMVLKVTTALNSSQGEDGAFQITGSANVYGVLLPNVGDMFIADVGDGREALIMVNAIKRKTYLQASTSEIEYTLTDWNSTKWATDLGRKVIRKLYFDAEYMRTGNKPLITEADRNYSIKFRKHYANLLDLFLTDFFSRVNGTLLVPDQTAPTYDPFVVEFLRNIVTSEDHPLVREMLVLNVTGDRRTYDETIWSCLEKMDVHLVPACTQRMGVVDIVHFKSRPSFNSIYFSLISRCVFPDERGTSIDQHYYRERADVVVPIQDGKVRYSSLDRALPFKTLMTTAAYGINAVEQPVVHPVTKDDYYVFSESFYKDTDGQSLIEALTLTALRMEPINLEALSKLCEDISGMANLERYYYIPVILLLIRIHQRSF